MLRNTIFIFIILVAGLVIPSCQNNSGPDLSQVSVDEVKIKRYGEALFGIDRKDLKNELSKLSGEYYFFVGNNFEDTLNLIQIDQFISNPFNQELHRECQEWRKGCKRRCPLTGHP